MLTMLAAASMTLSGCTATDGDTIRCGAERIRLLGIDAPELPGHCRTGRICALGDPWRSKANITILLRRAPLTIRRLGRDRYGRTLAAVSAGGRDLSCEQLRAGLATYRPDWDNARTIARTCPSITSR